jgi:type VI secretion system protein ImpA
MPFRDDLLNPIPGDNPSGINLRYDPVADKIKEARREDFEAPQGAWKSALKVADYGQVIKLAGETIATKGKDLQVAVWLVDAHVRREGFAALPPGFRFLQALLEQFWDTLYPEIEEDDLEVRAGPLQWLGSKLPEPIRALPLTSSGLTWFRYKDSRTVGYESDAGSSDKQAKRAQLIGEGKTTGEEFDQALGETPKAFYEKLGATLEDSLASLASLIDLCDSKFGDASPSFIKTREAMEEIANLVRGFINKKGGPTAASAPAAQPAAVEEPAPQVAPAPVVSTAVAAATPAAAPVREARAGGIEPASLEDAAARLAAIARYLRKQDVYNVAPYLILRGYRWGEIRYNGPDEIDTKMLEAPPPELRKQLKEAAQESQWDKVLETTEAAMELPCGRAWLDVHRYTVKALEKKGEYFKFVADAVRTGLRGLLQDLPKLMDMTLLDDTPAANPETIEWIREQVLSADGRGAPSPVVEEPPQQEREQQKPVPSARPAVEMDEKPPSMDEEDAGTAQVADVFESALEGARGGRLGEAIEILSAELERARSGRGRFKRRMQLAHIFMASGHEKIAYPILQELAEEIDRRGLEDWEAGDLLAHPLTLLLKCATSVNGNEDQVKMIYARICRLDPRKALQCLE